MKLRKKKMKAKKKSIAPFVTGAAIGTAVGILLAKKPGDELKENIGENFEMIKDKAKDAYESKGDLIDNIGRNIKKITKYEIKNFINPKYFSKEYDESGNVKQKIEDLKEDIEDFADDAEFDFGSEIEKAKQNTENAVRDVKEKAEDFVEDLAEDSKEGFKNIKRAVRDGKNEAEDFVEDVVDEYAHDIKKAKKTAERTVRDGKEKIKDLAEDVVDELK